jgi:glycosyltransferase involved in cell wall biosynthesis
MTRPIAINWEISATTAWGQTGLHICRALLRQGERPLLLHEPNLDHMSTADRQMLVPLAAAPLGKRATLPDGCIVLTPFGNELGSEPIADCPADVVRLGIGAFEETRIDADVRVRGQAFARLIVHSTWNQRVLDEADIRYVAMIHQGIDASEMHPLPRAGHFPGRFVIFSGGKLEFRKGQDIVLVAFRRFRERYPEALLLAAWHSPWPGAAETIRESPHLRAAPGVGLDGRLRVADWAAENGIPRDSFVDAGLLSRTHIPQVFAECDLAIFPNRCEGGTNMFAMEAMACGVPVVLSANTGHLDLIRPGICQTLDDQRSVVDPDGCRTGWGESSVDELVARMEAVRASPVGSRQAADYAMAFMRTERTWARFTTRVLEEIRTVG